MISKLSTTATARRATTRRVLTGAAAAGVLALMLAPAGPGAAAAGGSGKSAGEGKDAAVVLRCHGSLRMDVKPNGEATGVGRLTCDAPSRSRIESATLTMKGRATGGSGPDVVTTTDDHVVYNTNEVSDLKADRTFTRLDPGRTEARQAGTGTVVRNLFSPARQEGNGSGRVFVGIAATSWFIDDVSFTLDR
ncbi:hypothetical protein SMD11_2799 [Streptomyces albireticuli]|uniref:Uncharacterized protein n=1 Tax=Streptomyces albireticuli TaxID=1940 RepID=A0A1Z2L2C0_9ACTN|nr:hypothetical protein [Streptomyces albireticuli]ARZ68447.1 hypothetical protein SMD11_2799 [Streptomyces albireticuli]